MDDNAALGFGYLAMMMMVLIAGVAGLFFMFSKIGSTPYVDSFGNTTNAETNTSQQMMGNVTGVAPTIGTGIVIILAIVFVAAGAGVLYLAATRKGTGHSRYQ